MVKRIFKVEGMHCTSCALLIDEELEEVKGVKRAKTNYARQTTEVEFDERAVGDTTILTTIAQAGYKATPVLTT
jgi:Cu+-exporting ATPase